jgi:hypothetical protein
VTCTVWFCHDDLSRPMNPSCNARNSIDTPIDRVAAHCTYDMHSQSVVANKSMSRWQRLVEAVQIASRSTHVKNRPMGWNGGQRCERQLLPDY